MSANGKEVTTEIVPVFDAGVALRPVMNVASAKQQLAEFQELSERRKLK